MTVLDFIGFLIGFAISWPLGMFLVTRWFDRQDSRRQAARHAEFEKFWKDRAGGGTT